MLHIPILRHGTEYRSLDIARVPHHRTRELFVEVSQANPGLIRRDLGRQDIGTASLQRFSTRELVDICARGGEHFTNDPLPLGDSTQTADDYVQQVSATTGLPYTLARRNMLKIKSMFTNMESVLNGLTRNLDWDLLDRGFGEVDGRSMSFFPRTQSLGAVLPNNSPGVHSLWIPSFPLRIPLVLKPGSAEPWTPYRIIQALIKAGAPREAFSFYPAAQTVLTIGSSISTSSSRLSPITVVAHALTRPPFGCRRTRKRSVKRSRNAWLRSPRERQTMRMRSSHRLLIRMSQLVSTQ
jgi:hypothetical protein